MSQFYMNPELMDLRSAVGRPQYISHEQKMLMKWRKQSLLNQHQRCHSLGSSPLTRGLPGISSTKKSVAIKSSDVLSPRYLSTPLRSPHISRILGKEVKTPSTCGKKTPKNSGLPKTPLLLRSAKEPRLKANSTSKTPRTTCGVTGDRFIPLRAAVDKEAGYFMIMRAKSASDADDLGSTRYQQQMSDALGITAVESSRILHFSQNAPPCVSSSHDVLFRNGCSNNSFGSCGKKTSVARTIPSRPERILDAPDIINDYYLNLLSWSSSNVVSVGLNGAVYLWNASSREVTKLFDLSPSENYVSSVSWMPDCNILAVGTSAATVQIWDVSRQKLLRTMTGHASRVGSLSWNSHIISSGCRSGMIHNHDVRVASHHVGSLLSHTQEVCGLQWSPDGSYLASGGNDNLANIWDAVSGNSRTPVHRFTGHRAAVKAVAWCPWQNHILSTGSGSADCFIRFWNVNSGSLLHEIDTGSQISSILWSKTYHELVSGHGFNKNQLTIWKYPSMVKCAELLGHSDRVLSLALSPDGTVVASMSADETIWLWKCFEPEAKQRKHSQSQKICNSSVLGKPMLR